MSMMIYVTAAPINQLPESNITHTVCLAVKYTDNNIIRNRSK